MPAPSKSLAFLALTAIAFCSCVQAAPAVSVGACRSQCTSAASVCRKLHTSELSKCGLLYNCASAACKADPQCKYGCDTCKVFWNHYIGTCDSNYTVCAARCATA